MGDGEAKKFGLTLRKKEEEEKKTGQTANVFGEESDEEEAVPKTAAEKFKQKYANAPKSKDIRLVEKIMAEDPSIYDYDGQYEQMQQVRDQKIEEQKEADKEKKPKYAHMLIKAHKKRELEKLLHDEHTYKKEREQEAGEFDGKEVFVTDAYRKQIEEREQFRKEIEQSDALDEKRNVKNQSMWQQAFQWKMLEDRARVHPGAGGGVKKEEEGEEEQDKLVKTEQGEHQEEGTTRVKEEEGEQKPEKGELDRSLEELPAKRRRKDDEGKEKGGERGRRERTRTRSSEREEHRHKGRSSDRKESSISKGKGEETEEEPRPKGAIPPVVPVEDEMAELRRRMQRIREILQRHNDEEDIRAARERFLERQARGEIVPPF